MKFFFIETYGCQMNKADSNSIANDLINSGFIQTDSNQNADIIIINTCSVRKTAENRIWGRLGYYNNFKKNKNAVIVVAGCMAQRLGNDFFKKDLTPDIIVGNFQKDKISNILNNYMRDKKITLIEEETIRFSNSFPDNDNPKKAFVTISHGCNNFCSYCIVPYLRGREKSRPSNEIINDINNLTQKGVIQITLLGQNVNSYGNDIKDITFPQLLRKICIETDIKWIKYLSSHPKDFNDNLIDVIFNEKKISKWVHLALQSGSDKILKIMNRNYTIESYFKKIEYLKQLLPKINLTTDIIVGFPGETHDDYIKTLNAVNAIGFDDAYMYKYNVRENTLAFNELKDNVTETEKTERLSELIRIQREITRTNKLKRVGDTFKVISEKWSKKTSNEIIGLTNEDLMIVFKGNDEDFKDIINVNAVKIEGNTLYGQKV